MAVATCAAMALLDMLSVALAARDVLDDRFSIEDCEIVVSALKKVGLTTMASLRTGFPADSAQRELYVRGFCKEVGIDSCADLLLAMALGALNLSLDACSSAFVLRPDAFSTKRLHGGTWVEAEAPVLKAGRSSSPDVILSTGSSSIAPPGAGAGTSRFAAPPGAKAAGLPNAALLLTSVSASLVATATLFRASVHHHHHSSLRGTRL